MATKQQEKYVIQIDSDSAIPAYIHSVRLRSVSLTRWINEARKFNNKEAATKFCQDHALDFWRKTFIIIKLEKAGL